MPTIALQCPECGCPRIAQQLQAAVLYLVEYVEPSAANGYREPHVQITDPADVVDGHVQYELTGGEPDLYCLNPNCQYDSTSFWDFMPPDDEEIDPDD